MRYTAFFLLLFGLQFSALAQDAQGVETSSDATITWSLNAIQYDQAFPYQSRDFLTTKLRTTLSKKGQIVQKTSMGIIEVHTLSSTEEVNTGMKNMTVARVEISLIAKESLEGSILASYEQTISGSGDNADKAFKQAVRNFKANSKLESFFTAANTGFGENMAKNCDRYLAEARKQSQVGNFSQSLAILLAVPNNGSCFEEANGMLATTYQAMQQKKCNEFVLQAKSHASAGKYQQAARILGHISGDAPCMQDAQQVAETIRTNSREDMTATLDALKAAWANPLQGTNLRASILYYLQN